MLWLGMNETETETGAGPVYEFNWYLLYLILGTVLLCKLLKYWSPSFCGQLVRWWIQEPPSLTSLRKEVASMKHELKQIDMLDNFADHARLQRKLNHKDQELQLAEKTQRSQFLKLNAIIGTVASIAILLLRVGVSIYYRHTPVAVFPTEILYPLSGILSFPTGIPGGIGCPLWGVACTQFIDTVIYWWTFIRTKS